MESIYVLIPAYKPDENLWKLLDDMDQRFVPVVVNDGSGSDYEPIFDGVRTRGITVLTHPQNRGKGAALKTGLAFLSEHTESQGVVTADSDGQHSPTDIARVAQAMAANPDAIVLGGRDFSAMPLKSKAGNTITRFFFRLSTGQRISDTQTGLRGLPRRFWPALLAIPGNRYEYEMDVLLGLKAMGARAVEIPIQTIYIDNNSATHFHPVRDGLKVFSRVLRYCVASLSCTLLDFGLYTLLLLWLPVYWAYIGARVVSSTVNYQLNRRVVFHGRPSYKSAAKYLALVLVVMGVGSLATTGLKALGLHSVVAKLLVDTVLFVCNYIVQRKMVFTEGQ